MGPSRGGFRRWREGRLSARPYSGPRLNRPAPHADEGGMAPQTESELRAIIRTQTEIAATDLDLAAILQLIADRAQDLTQASAGVIEFVEDEEMVYSVTTGEATPYLGTKLKV